MGPGEQRHRQGHLRWPHQYLRWRQPGGLSAHRRPLRPASLSTGGVAARLPVRDPQLRCGVPAPSTRRSWLNPVASTVEPRHRQQEVDLPAVRSPGADQHHTGAGWGCCGAACKGHAEGHSGDHRRQRSLLLPGPLYRRDDCRGRGVPQPGVRRR